MQSARETSLNSGSGKTASGEMHLGVRNSEETAPALDGDAHYVCSDCDLHQVEPMEKCPACGGEVVAKLDDDEVEDADPLIGRTIGKRFTVIARLGAGSMGAVYRARQMGMAREVALKVLKPERAFDASSQQRFEREARATSALESPNTVRVYDFGEDDSTPQGPLLYLAMERLDGESLGQRLKTVPRLTSKDAIRIAQQTLRSLAEAHDKGVIHRDLKPDNIFLHRTPTPHGTEETVKVLDFGIAKILQPDLKVDALETQAGTVFGTPRYMSPEQAQSKPLDGRSDLYTVGLILYQMVTGRHVFTDDDAVVVMARHIQSLPQRPREIAPEAGISKKLEALILRTLAKDPKRRPQSAQELHDALEDVLHAPPESQSDGSIMGSAVTTSGAMQISLPMPAVAAASEVPVADTSIQTSAHPTLPSSSRKAGGRRFFFAIAGAAAVLLAVALGARLGQRATQANAAAVESADDLDEATRHAAAASKHEDSSSATPSATVPTLAVVDESASHRPTTAPSSTRPSHWAATPHPVASAAAEPSVAAPAPTAAPSATTKKPPSGYGKFD